MPRSHHSEMPPIRREYLPDAEALGDGDHRRIHKPQGEVAVRHHEIGGTANVLRPDAFDGKFPVRERPYERLRGAGAEPGLQQVRHLRYHGDRDQEVGPGGTPPGHHPFVPVVTPVG